MFKKNLPKEKCLEKFQYSMKISGKMSKHLTDTLAKKVIIFAYFSVSDHSASFSLFLKKPILFRTGG